jgi:hypothetical protein
MTKLSQSGGSGLRYVEHEEAMLFSFERAFGFHEGERSKISAGQSKGAFNGHAFMVGKVVGAVLPYQGAGAAKGKEHEDQAGHLQPESIEGPAERDDHGFGSGKHGVEQAVFLYNALHGIFDCGNLRHFAYCSPKIGVF